MFLILAIVSAVSLGIADFLAGVALRRDGRNGSAMTYGALGSLLGLFVVLAAIPIAHPEVFTRSDLMWSIAAGVAFGIALPLLMIGMALGPIAIVAPVLGLVSLAIPASVGPILGDSLTGLELMGLLVAFPAAALIASHAGPDGSGMSTRRAVLLGVATGALLGTSAVCFGQTGQDSGIGPAIIAQLTATVGLFAAAIATRRLVRPVRPALAATAGVGLLSAVGVLLSVLAYQRGPVAIVAAVIGLAPGPTVLLAWLIFRERISRRQLPGFALGVVAVVLFAV